METKETQLTLHLMETQFPIGRHLLTDKVYIANLFDDILLRVDIVQKFEVKLDLQRKNLKTEDDTIRNQ